jgi:hypothetical protein
MEFVELFFVGTTLVLLVAQGIDALKRQGSVHASSRRLVLDDAANATAMRSVLGLGCNPPRVRCELNSFNAAAKDMRRGHERQPHKRASCATPISGS